MLDGALVSDGESLRVITQIFETLIALKPGTTELEPGLAKSWEVERRRHGVDVPDPEGVTFHDGETFDAEAVCFNFDRWYNFTGALAEPGASYYWQMVFGGFATVHRGPARRRTASTRAARRPRVDRGADLTKPSATFIPALCRSSRSRSPARRRCEEFNADEGSLDAEGVFMSDRHLRHRASDGTGPFKFVSWTPTTGSRCPQYEDYWGYKAKLDELIFRPIADNAARLQAVVANGTRSRVLGSIRSGS